MGIESFGGVALFRFHPLGGLPSPIWPLDILVLVFVRGDRPHLGEIWILAGLHFGPLFWVTETSQLQFFCRAKVRTAYFLSWQFNQNRNSAIQANFFQSLKKHAISQFLGCERRKYSKCSGRYNGLMLGSRGRRFKKSGCRHISTSGLASSALGTLVFVIFWPVLLPYRIFSWQAYSFTDSGIAVARWVVSCLNFSAFSFDCFTFTTSIDF